MKSFLLTSVRQFSVTSLRYSKAVPKNLKGKSKSSQEWLTRQLSDPYVERAKLQNYRCRSAFKLLEINEKYSIIKPGDVIVDCGASPGSWTQVAVHASNSNKQLQNKPNGLVVGVDLLPIYPIEGASVMGNMDFTTESAQNSIKEKLMNRPINCVISDMAPNATGVRTLDQENIITLCYAVLRFAAQMSALNANLVMKVWDNGEVPLLEKSLTKFYRNVKSVKPLASRADSAEKFLLARGFVGLEK